MAGNTFEEGDRVRHRGEGVEGVIESTEYTPPHFKVKWDDGYETLENFHTAELIEDSR